MIGYVLFEITGEQNLKGSRKATWLQKSGKTLKVKHRCQEGERKPTAAMFPDYTNLVLVLVHGHPHNNSFCWAKLSEFLLFASQSSLILLPFTLHLVYILQNIYRIGNGLTASKWPLIKEPSSLNYNIASLLPCFCRCPIKVYSPTGAREIFINAWQMMSFLCS